MIKFDKKTFMPIIVLVSICVIVAALLGGVNMLTSPVIKEAEEAKANAALLVVLPGAKNFEKIETNENYPKEIKTAYKADIGFVFEVAVKGKDVMTLMCGVDSDGNFVGLDIISESETPDYKNKVFPLMTGENGKYNGKNSETLEPEIVSGATLTSNGIYSAVKISLDAYTVANGGEIEKEEKPGAEYHKSETELLTLAAELVENSTGFTKVEIEGDYETLVSVYKENGAKGYVAYVVVISENYGTVESEALIHIGMDGKIKGINKLTWKTSDAIYGYVPPTSEAVDEFYGRLVGSSASTIDGVELVTNATNTSTNVVASFKEALTAVSELIKKDMPTPEEDILSLAVALMGTNPEFENVTPSGNEYLKRVYRDKNGNGYVAYVVVISENYGTVESEALIHIGTDGKIKALDKMTWKTSDAIYGYVPPSAEAVDAFYASLVGNTAQTIDGVDLVTNATNTSTNVVASFKEALSAVDELIPQYKEVSIVPRVIGIVALVALIAALAALVIFTKKMRGGRNV